MKKTILSTLVTASVSAAAFPAMADVNAELEALKARISQLEEQSNTPKWDQRVQLGANFDFLATVSEDKAGTSSSDLAVDTAEISLEAQLSDSVAVSAILAEDDGFILDEALISVTSADESLSMIAGRTGVSFAAVNSESWTSPLTDDFLDHTDTLVQVAWSQNGLNADVYAFNAGGDTIENFGANFGAELNGFNIGAGFLNNIRNTSSFEDAVTDGEINGGGKLEAYRVNAAYSLDSLTVSAEYLMSSKVKERDNKALSVWDISADYSTQLLGAASLISFTHSETSNAANIFSEKRTVLGVNREVSENISVTAEYARESDYDDTYSNTANLVLMTSF